MDWLSKGEVARVELFVLLHRQSDRGCKTQACAACSKSNQGQAWLGNCVISRCNSPAGTGLNCQNTPKATEARGGQATRGESENRIWPPKESGKSEYNVRKTNTRILHGKSVKKIHRDARAMGMANCVYMWVSFFSLLFPHLIPFAESEATPLSQRPLPARPLPFYFLASSPRTTTAFQIKCLRPM